MTDISPSVRMQAATYCTGFFSLSLAAMGTLAVPLWALEIGASPLWIGIAIGARSIAPLIYAIRGGLLMDRIGPKRVLIVLGLISVATAPLHPMLPFVWGLILLQLVTGLAHNTAWAGAQTQLARIAKGSPKLTGRFTFFTTLGTFSGPLVAGLTWDWWGAWGTFGALTVWSAGLVIAALAIPDERSPAPTPDATPENTHPDDVQPHRLRPVDLLPRATDYASAVRLAMMSGVSIIVAATFLRNCAFGVRLSFFPVYLESISLDGFTIGILLAASSLVAGPTGLVLPSIMRALSDNVLMFGSLVIMTVSISLAPLFISVPALVLLALVFGFGTGINLPTLLSVLSRAVKPEVQGLSVGLRTTTNLLGGLLVPVIMGAVADAYDLETAFYVIGIGTMVLIGASLLLIRPARKDSTP